MSLGITSTGRRATHRISRGRPRYDRGALSSPRKRGPIRIRDLMDSRFRGNDDKRFRGNDGVRPTV
jgi:hypothetical protein